MMGIASRLNSFFKDAEAVAKQDIPSYAIIVAPEVDTLVKLLADCRRLRALLHAAEQEVEDELVKAMEGKTATVAGVGEVTKHSGAQRRAWQHDDLIVAMTHAIADKVPNLVNAETGVMIDHVQLTGDIIREFREAATPSWKVTGLRDHGIDPHEYCETTWGRKTVTVPAVEANLKLEG